MTAHALPTHGMPRFMTSHDGQMYEAQLAEQTTCTTVTLNAGLLAIVKHKCEAQL